MISQGSKDAWLHVTGAVLLTGIALVLPANLGFALLNAAIWLAREWEQDDERRWPWYWSGHKHMEWVMPTAAGFFLVALFNWYLDV